MDQKYLQSLKYSLGHSKRNLGRLPLCKGTLIIFIFLDLFKHQKPLFRIKIVTRRCFNSGFLCLNNLEFLKTIRVSLHYGFLSHNLKQPQLNTSKRRYFYQIVEKIRIFQYLKSKERLAIRNHLSPMPVPFISPTFKTTKRKQISFKFAIFQINTD